MADKHEIGDEVYFDVDDDGVVYDAISIIKGRVIGIKFPKQLPYLEMYELCDVARPNHRYLRLATQLYGNSTIVRDMYLKKHKDGEKYNGKCAIHFGPYEAYRQNTQRKVCAALKENKSTGQFYCECKQEVVTTGHIPYAKNCEFGIMDRRTAYLLKHVFRDYKLGE